MRRISFDVRGIPAPQGSKKHVGNGIMVESSAKVRPWREAVKTAALDANVKPISGPVAVAIQFRFTRPKGHYGTGRNAQRLKPSAPRWPSVKPDLDKLSRSTLDAISEDLALIDDDSRVVQLIATKEYADTPGAFITITGVRP